MNITKGKQSRPQRVVIYGAEGVGKSTLAALNAPRPIFLDTEDGTAHLDVDRVAIHTLDDLSGALRELLVLKKTGAGEYESVVLDTADRLWGMCAEALCSAKNWSSIESPGYGSGYAQAAEKFRAVFSGFDALMRAGYHVVIICHAKTDKVTPPDNPEYTKYMIKVSAPTKQAETSREYIKEWCDALLFCHFEVAVDAEKRRALGREAKRVIATVPSPAWEAKNRLELPEELPMKAGVLSKLFGNDERRMTNDPSSPLQGYAVASECKARQAAPAGGADEVPAEEQPQDAGVLASDQDFTVWTLAGCEVTLQDADARALVEYFIAVGKLSEGQTLTDLPMNLQAAMASRTAAAIAAARKWSASAEGSGVTMADAQKGGEA